jgi:hypothetical protein
MEIRAPASHSNFVIPYGEEKTARISASDMLYEKVATTPIPKGGAVTGLLVFLTKGVSYERLISERSPVTVVFTDVRGSECRVEQQGRGMSAPLHQPGYDDPFEAVLLQQAKETKAGQKLYYSVVEK